MKKPEIEDAAKRLIAALKRYGTAISDMFGHDEQFTSAYHDLQRSLGLIPPGNDDDPN